MQFNSPGPVSYFSILSPPQGAQLGVAAVADGLDGWNILGFTEMAGHIFHPYLKQELYLILRL